MTGGTLSNELMLKLTLEQFGAALDAEEDSSSFTRAAENTVAHRSYMLYKIAMCKVTSIIIVILYFYSYC